MSFLPPSVRAILRPPAPPPSNTSTAHAMLAWKGCDSKARSWVLAGDGRGPTANGVSPSQVHMDNWTKNAPAGPSFCEFWRRLVLVAMCVPVRLARPEIFARCSLVASRVTRRL